MSQNRTVEVPGGNCTAVPPLAKIARSGPSPPSVAGCYVVVEARSVLLLPHSLLPLVLHYYYCACRGVLRVLRRARFTFFVSF